jgi:hypothetical protein
MKELILIVMMFVFGDMQEEASNMTQYIPYDKMSHCLKDARAIKSGRPTLNTAISEDSKGKRASCGLKIVELVDGKMITMHATADDVPAGTQITKGDTTKVPYSVVKEWVMESKGKWDSQKKKKVKLGD